MKKEDLKENIRLIQFFQSGHYLDRIAQIEPYEGYDSYLDYYIAKRLDPIRYLKARIKNGAKKNEDPIAQIEEILKKIDPKDYVCILSPFYKGKPLDGYTKRVEQIDEKVLDDKKKIYLDHTDLANRNFSIEGYDDGHIIVKYNSFDPKHREAIRKIIDAVRKVYIHSVHVLMPDIADYRLFDILFQDGNKTILDLHGAVSDELKQFDTKERSELAQTVEKIVMDLSDRIVCMSKAMGDHYVERYGIDPKKLIVMTIMPFGSDEKLDPKKPEHDPLKAVYSGGIQKWQNIDRIHDSIKANRNRYSFTVFTQDSEALRRDWSDLAGEGLDIRTGTAEEIYKEYENCDFGYLLRDDNVVNNVSCPTKSIEYIRYGIIPIFLTDRIGDYPEYGLRYLSIKDFDQGIIPDEKERREMIENNFRVLKKIIEVSDQGKEEIRDYMK